MNSCSAASTTASPPGDVLPVDDNDTDEDDDAAVAREDTLPTTPLSVAVDSVSVRLYDEVMKCMLGVLSDIDLRICYDLALPGSNGDDAGTTEGRALLLHCFGALHAVSLLSAFATHVRAPK